MPWLMGEVEQRLDRIVEGRAVLDALLRTVVSQRIEAFSKLDAALKQQAGDTEQTQATTVSPDIV